MNIDGFVRETAGAELYDALTSPEPASARGDTNVLLCLILQELRSIRARMSADAACGFSPLSERATLPCTCANQLKLGSVVRYCPKDCPARPKGTAV